MRLQIGSIEMSCHEILILHDPHHKGDRRFHPAQDVFFERASHAADGFFPRTAPHGELGQEGVIVGRYGVVFVDRSIDSHPDPARREVGGNGAGARPEVVLRVLRVDPALDGMALERDLLLGDVERACLLQWQSDCARYRSP